LKCGNERHDSLSPELKKWDEIVKQDLLRFGALRLGCASTDIFATQSVQKFPVRTFSAVFLSLSL